MKENENNLSAEVNEGFATEMLREIKAQLKRWFVIAVLEFIGLIILSGFAWWCSYLPEEVTTTTVSEEASADDGSTAFVGDNNIFGTSTEEIANNG